MSTVTSETATIIPAAGWYRLQACTDEVETYTDLEPDRDADHQDSIGYVFGDDVTKPPMTPPGKIAWVEEGMPSVAVIGGC
jgi:hypothetical protein